MSRRLAAEGRSLETTRSHEMNGDFDSPWWVLTNGVDCEVDVAQRVCLTDCARPLPVLVGRRRVVVHDDGDRFPAVHDRSLTEPERSRGPLPIHRPKRRKDASFTPDRDSWDHDRVRSVATMQSKQEWPSGVQGLEPSEADAARFSALMQSLTSASSRILHSHRSAKALI